VIVDCALYQDGSRQPGSLTLDEVPAACHLANAFVWIGLHEPTEEEFDRVKREFDLHELAVEDAIKAHQRPKLEVYGNSLFVVLKTVRYLQDVELVEFGEILVFAGDGFIVVVRHGEATALKGVRRAIEQRTDLLRSGPGAVLHAIVDQVVDDYAPALDGIDDDIREVEASVFSDEDENPVERIYKLKREILEFHEATVPLIEPLVRLSSPAFSHVHQETHAYFRDVADHLQRIVAQVETDRDLLTSVLEANLTRVSVRMNEDMRKISAWVAIAAVPTAVAGIYGMNFEHMPELTSRAGYPLTLAVIAAICAFLYKRFRRAGWL
jgi:magnesium transporter